MTHYGRGLAAAICWLLIASAAGAQPTPTPSPAIALTVAYPNPAITGETVMLEARALGYPLRYGWRQIRLADEPGVGFSMAALRIVEFTAPSVTVATVFRFEVTLTLLPFGPELGRETVDVTVLPALPDGVTISGRVAESPPCDGGVNGQVVVLSPLGWTEITGTVEGQPGHFAFEGVPPGPYEVQLFGDGILRCFTCYPPVSADAQTDVEVDLCPVEASPTPTQTPSSPTATNTRTATATATPSVTRTGTPTNTATPCGAKDLQTLDVTDGPVSDCVTAAHDRRYRIPVQPDGLYVAYINAAVQVSLAERETGPMQSVLDYRLFGFGGSSTGFIFITVSALGSSQTDYELTVQVSPEAPLVRVAPEENDLGADSLGQAGLGGATLYNDGSQLSAVRVNGVRIRVSDPRLGDCFGFSFPPRCSTSAPCIILGGGQLTTMYKLLRTRPACTFPRQAGSGPTATLVFDLQPGPDWEMPIYGETLPFPCPGDCGGDDVVDGADVLAGVQAVLARLDRRCLTYDHNGDDRVTVDEVVGAVAASLGPCHP